MLNELFKIFTSLRSVYSVNIKDTNIMRPTRSIYTVVAVVLILVRNVEEREMQLSFRRDDIIR